MSGQADELERLRQELSDARRRIAELEGSRLGLRRHIRPGSIRTADIHSLVEQNSDGIAIIDRLGNVLFVNEAVSKMIGRPIDELMTSAFGAGFSTGGRQEITVHKVDGSEAVIESLRSGIVWGGEQVNLVTFREITAHKLRARELEQACQQLKKTQSQLIQSEKMAVIGQMAAGIAHEINNPLTSVIGSLSMLRERSMERLASIDPNACFFLDKAIRNAQHARDIIGDLLTFARPSDDDFVLCGLSDGIHKALTLLEYQRVKAKVTVRLDLQDTLRVRCLPRQMAQVFINLIANAYQAMAEKGGTLTVRSYQKEGMIFVEINDTGPGILPEHIDKVFDPFFTTKEEGKGTGLGLSIVYNIVQKHGGCIDVLSDAGVGTRFTISIPGTSSA